MSANVIESYLVSLGFEIKDNELKKFDLALKQAGESAAHHTTGVAQQFLKWQTAIVGGFAAIGLATIGLMDKVADADLGYQQLARQMGTSKNVARDYSIVLKSLGVTLADATWNPEIRARVRQGVADARLLRSELGIGGKGDSHDDALKRIRDMAFQFDRLKIAGQFIAIDVVSKIAQAFGGKQNTLKDWVDWVIKNAPKVSDWVVTHLVPVLKDAEHVLLDVWRVAEKLASSFLRLVGAVSGDESLRDGKLNFDNFGKAIDKTADYLVKFVDSVTSAELVVIDLVTGVVDLVKALGDLLHLDMSKLGQDWGHVKGDFGIAGGDFKNGGAGGAAALGLGGLGMLLGAKTVGGVFRGILSAGRAGAGGVVEGAGAGGLLATLGLTAAAGGLAVFAGSNANKGMQEWAWQKIGKRLGLPDLSGIGRREEAWENQFAPLRWLNSLKGGPGSASAGTPVINPATSQDPIAAAAGRYGISADLARAVAWRESYGGHMTDKNGNLIVNPKSGATGMFQLMKGTADAYGVDRTTLAGNVEGGVHLLSDLLSKYGGNIREALAAYNWGSGNLDKSIKKHGGFALDYLPAETRNYVQAIEKRMGQSDASSQVAVNIRIDHMNATPDQVAAAVKKGVREAQGKVAQSNYLNARPVHA